ncbi:MAG: hypothetical protein PVI84_03750, partial [Syntrophobacterales bacterium]|jgi:hypothetical protein
LQETIKIGCCCRKSTQPEKGADEKRIREIKGANRLVNFRSLTTYFNLVIFTFVISGKCLIYEHSSEGWNFLFNIENLVLGVRSEFDGFAGKRGFTFKFFVFLPDT